MGRPAALMPGLGSESPVAPSRLQGGGPHTGGYKVNHTLAAYAWWGGGCQGDVQGPGTVTGRASRVASGPVVSLGKSPFRVIALPLAARRVASKSACSAADSEAPWVGASGVWEMAEGAEDL